MRKSCKINADGSAVLQTRPAAKYVTPFGVSLPSKASSTIRSHVSSVYEEQRKVDKSENNLSDVIRPALQTSPSPDVGRAEYTVNYKQSVSSLENNDSETLL
ncbi:unnamed protein product [Nippostrongylus brasiliensis]|uniref:SUN domain-containing ossification factor n=1 Tax=Nippostrongylus brasiliensis TaxID=27835 RepID=A0A0N4YPZ9_NIPBR|nr:unnamed protein product [Nippostrongylus brasiliensis]